MPSAEPCIVPARGEASEIQATSLWKQQPVRVSGVFIAYNQESFVRQALTSVLEQKYPMDLIVSDDCSTDGTPEVIRATLHNYEGRHRVRVRYGSKNLRVCGNQNVSIGLAEGELIVLFEGDDYSVPERVTKIVHAYLARRRSVGTVGSAIRLMDSGGRVGRVVPSNADRGPHGSGLSFRRDVFFEVGPISKRLVSGDIALCLRSLFVVEGGICLVQDALVNYRVHETNVSQVFGWDFSSVEALRASCRCLVNHEVARIYELRKIERYRRRLGIENDGLQDEWQKLLHLSRARARLVLAVGRRPRLIWIWPALLACRFPVWRGKAVRVIVMAIVPWIGEFYRSFHGRKQRAQA